MRTQYLAEGMPKKVPMTPEVAFVCLLLLVSVVGILAIPVYILNTHNGRAAQTARNWNKRVRKRFVDFIGKEPQYIDVSVFGYDNGFKGTGMAYSDGYIYIMQGGYAAEFEWHEVREWSYRIENPDLIMPRNLTSASVNHIYYNMRSAGMAAAASGFALRVSSIEAPSWQFTTSDQRICEKWMEICNQLNENNGKLAA